MQYNISGFVINYEYEYKSFSKTIYLQGFL